MDRRNQPHEFWGSSVAWWWRMWQTQMEQGMRFWGAMAVTIPHQSARELSAEAELVKSRNSGNAAPAESVAKAAPKPAPRKPVSQRRTTPAAKAKA